jgi:hypothetical protein
MEWMSGRAKRRCGQARGADLAAERTCLRGRGARRGLCTDESTLLFATKIYCTYRNSAYKRERGRENDRRPSSKAAFTSRSSAAMSRILASSSAVAAWRSSACGGDGRQHPAHAGRSTPRCHFFGLGAARHKRTIFA